MRIAEINTYLLKAPTESAFYSSQGLFTGRKSLIVEIVTDDGTSGWGEGGQYGPAEPVLACIRDVLAPKLIGADPRTPGLHWENLYAAYRDFGTRGPYIEALSALDIAMWDLTGKSYGVPVAKLLGGAFRDSVAAYGTGFYYPADDPATVDAGWIRAEAAAKLDAGFGALKAKVGLLPIRDDIHRMEIVREAVGDDVALMVDSNHAYNLASARTVAAELGHLAFRWFEEPVVPEDKAAYRALRETSPVPIAGGEAEFTRYGFAELIGGGCVDVAQPDLAVAGGISEWQKIHTIAQVAGVTVIPHIWGSGIALAAALQVLAATPPNPYTARPVPLQNEPVLEFDTTDNPLRRDLLTEPFTIDGGRVAVSGAPGLGVEVDRDVLGRYDVLTRA
ncbi:mandelate racemase/muconate lactonizing enzyme family protein [Microbacterium sp.]|uniref:mandelate racemase/muconate lactonizing enzyme family protein n=1 Tax=Microbacterium sp. TaxID=51671 RepID=UPI0037C982FF